MNVRIQSRHDTAKYWKNNDPVLLDGEIGVENDTGKFKIGNGVDSYLNLPYANEFEQPEAMTNEDIEKILGGI
jgi:hypothetical protein